MSLDKFKKSMGKEEAEPTGINLDEEIEALKAYNRRLKREQAQLKKEIREMENKAQEAPVIDKDAIKSQIGELINWLSAGHYERYSDRTGCKSGPCLKAKIMGLVYKL